MNLLLEDAKKFLENQLMPVKRLRKKNSITRLMQQLDEKSKNL